MNTLIYFALDLSLGNAIELDFKTLKSLVFFMGLVKSFYCCYGRSRHRLKLELPVDFSLLSHALIHATFLGVPVLLFIDLFISVLFTDTHPLRR